MRLPDSSSVSSPALYSSHPLGGPPRRLQIRPLNPPLSAPSLPASHDLALLVSPQFSPPVPPAHLSLARPGPRAVLEPGGPRSWKETQAFSLGLVRECPRSPVSCPGWDEGSPSQVVPWRGQLLTSRRFHPPPNPIPSSPAQGPQERPASKSGASSSTQAQRPLEAEAKGRGKP